jgi:hypothetical protein
MPNNLKNDNESITKLNQQWNRPVRVTERSCSENSQLCATIIENVELTPKEGGKSPVTISGEMA